MYSYRNYFKFISKSKLSAHLWSVAIILLSLVTLALVKSIANQIHDQAQKDIQKELFTVLKATQGAIHLWRQDLQVDLQTLSELPSLNKLVLEQIKHKDDANSLLRITEFKKILAPWIRSHGYLNITVLSKDESGQIKFLFDKDPGLDELLNQDEFLFRQAFMGEYQLGEPQIIKNSSLVRPENKQEVVMIAAVPIKNDKNQTLAVLAISIDVFSTFTAYTQLGQIGKTGETYAVNRLGQMVTANRFNFQPLHNLIEMKEPKGDYTFMAKEIRNGDSGLNLKGYNDYRGKNVVGAWLWDEGLKLGLATELDKEEAYLSYNMIQKLRRIILFIIVSGMAILVLLREGRIRNLWRIKSLKESERMRKELLSVVSHDLKNPLSVLLMTNELLLKTLPPNLDFSERRRKLLQKSQTAAQQMRRLITDLLDSARIEAGKLEIHPIKCSGEEILEHAFEVLEPIAVAKGLRLSKILPAVLPPLNADPERVLQVFSNLIGNAIKFTEPNGEVKVQAKILTDTVEFSVSDTGPGISPEDIPHLFERYWQAKKAKSFGTGLGLTICKELIAAHNGKIWVDSVLGQGTTFHFTLAIYPSLIIPKDVSKLELSGSTLSSLKKENT